MSSERGPQLVRMNVADDREAWAAAGFVSDPVMIGSLEIRFEAGSATSRGITGWTFQSAGDSAAMPTDIDGIATTWADAESATAAPANVLEQSTLDHVVMFSSDLDRSTAALEAAGFPARRQRDVPGTTPPRRQVFFWAGDAIIELVGPVDPDPENDSPASLWGIAITASDIDALATEMGDRMGPIKPAVQEGRRISTIRTRDLSITVAIAVMSPHQNNHQNNHQNDKTEK